MCVCVCVCALRMSLTAYSANWRAKIMTVTSRHVDVDVGVESASLENLLVNRPAPSNVPQAPAPGIVLQPPKRE